MRHEYFAVFGGILTHTCRALSEHPDGREGEGDGGHEAAGDGRGEPEEHRDSQGEVRRGGGVLKSETESDEKNDTGRKASPHLYNAAVANRQISAYCKSTNTL